MSLQSDYDCSTVLVAVRSGRNVLIKQRLCKHRMTTEAGEAQFDLVMVGRVGIDIYPLQEEVGLEGVVAIRAERSTAMPSSVEVEDALEEFDHVCA